MLDLYSNVFLFRGIERLIIVLGGFFFAYLGYRLFIFGVGDGHGKLTTESPFLKLTFSGSGPGLFFMAFGAIVLVYSLFSTAQLDQIETVASQLEVAPADAPTTEVTHKVSLKFSGENAICDQLRLSAHNNDPEETLWVYANATEDSAFYRQLKAFADTINQAKLDHSVQIQLLQSMEDTICAIES